VSEAYCYSRDGAGYGECSALAQLRADLAASNLHALGLQGRLDRAIAILESDDWPEAKCQDVRSVLEGHP